MTVEGEESLRTELQHLITYVRPNITKKIISRPKNTKNIQHIRKTIHFLTFTIYIYIW